MKRIQNFIKRFKRELKDQKLLKRIPKKTVQSNSYYQRLGQVNNWIVKETNRIQNCIKEFLRKLNNIIGEWHNKIWKLILAEITRHRSVAYWSFYITARWCLHSCLASKPQQNKLGPVLQPSRCNNQGMLSAINFEVFQTEKIEAMWSISFKTLFQNKSENRGNSLKCDKMISSYSFYHQDLLIFLKPIFFLIARLASNDVSLQTFQGQMRYIRYVLLRKACKIQWCSS